MTSEVIRPQSQFSQNRKLIGLKGPDHHSDQILFRIWIITSKIWLRGKELGLVDPFYVDSARLWSCLSFGLLRWSGGHRVSDRKLISSIEAAAVPPTQKTFVTMFQLRPEIDLPLGSPKCKGSRCTYSNHQSMCLSLVWQLRSKYVRQRLPPLVYSSSLYYAVFPVVRELVVLLQCFRPSLPLHARMRRTS